MKKTTLIIVCLLFFNNINAQPFIQWGGYLNSNHSAIITDIISDKDENIYVLGMYADTINANIKNGTYWLPLQFNSNSFNYFLSKYDKDGNIIYARHFFKSTDASAQLSKMYYHNNAIYILGYTKFTGSGVYANSPSGSSYGFITTTLNKKTSFLLNIDLDSLYVKNLDNYGSNVIVNDVCFGKGDIMYIVGEYYSGGVLGNTVDQTDVFFMKKKISNHAIIWTKKMGQMDHDFGNAIYYDTMFNNLYISMDFSDTVDIDPSNSVVNIIHNSNNTHTGHLLYTTSGVVAYYDSNGNYVWHREYNDLTNDISKTNSNYIVLKQSNSILLNDYLLSLYWQEPINSINGYNFEIDSVDNFYITGSYSNQISFNVNNNVVQFNTGNTSNNVINSYLYIMDLNTKGINAKEMKCNYKWSSKNYLSKPILSNNGNIYFFNNYTNDSLGVNFDFNNSTSFTFPKTIKNGTLYNRPVLLKYNLYNQTPNSSTNFLSDIKYQLFPNPASVNSTISFNSPNSIDANIIITDLMGKTIYSTKDKGYVGDHLIKIPLENVNNGMYFISVYSNNQLQQTMKLIKE